MKRRPTAPASGRSRGERDLEALRRVAAAAVGDGRLDPVAWADHQARVGRELRSVAESSRVVIAQLEELVAAAEAAAALGDELADRLRAAAAGELLEEVASC